MTAQLSSSGWHSVKSTKQLSDLCSLPNTWSGHIFFYQHNRSVLHMKGGAWQYLPWDLKGIKSHNPHTLSSASVTLNEMLAMIINRVSSNLHLTQEAKLSTTKSYWDKFQKRQMPGKPRAMPTHHHTLSDIHCNHGLPVCPLMAP